MPEGIFFPALPPQRKSSAYKIILEAGSDSVSCSWVAPAVHVCVATHGREPVSSLLSNCSAHPGGLLSITDEGSSRVSQKQRTDACLLSSITLSIKDDETCVTNKTRPSAFHHVRALVTLVLPVFP